MARPKKDPSNSSLPSLETQSPLNVIRSETVLSRLPLHNLTKRGKFEIKIKKKKPDGEVDLSWHVSPNRDYGEPRQLAYKLDTIVINSRIDRQGKRLHKLLFLGSSRELCLELGLTDSGTNLLNVQKALLANAGALIVAKVNYYDKDGLARNLDAGFTRYDVILRGERLPDGTYADAIYINFSDIYFEVIKNAPVRPLDFNYLKKLPPSAQRFYELLSYKIFAAFTNKKTTAILSYSEFCTFSAQTRYYDYEHFKKQMYKIHKPHLDSGYIASVQYSGGKDDEGKIDWLMCYKPGPKARAEYQAFNNKKKYEADAMAALSLESMADTEHPRKFSKARLPETTTKTTLPTPVITPKEKPVVQNTRAKLLNNIKATSSEALLLVQKFHLMARGVENYQPYSGSREESQAQSLLNNYGKEESEAIISFAVKQAKRTNFEMRTFGAIFQYVSDAITEYEKTTKAKSLQSSEEAKKKKEFEAHFASVVGSLTPKQYQALYEQAKQHILTEIPSMTADAVETSLQPLLKRLMVDLLESSKKTTQK